MSVVRVPASVSKQLEALAKETSHSKSYYVAEALKDFLEERADYFLAASRLEKLQKGESRTYSLEEVARELNLPLP